MVWDSDRNRAVLFGGFCSDLQTSAVARCNDIWEWDGTGGGTWTNRTPAGARSRRRACITRRSTTPAARRWSSSAATRARAPRHGHLGRRDLGVGRHGRHLDEDDAGVGQLDPVLLERHPAGLRRRPRQGRRLLLPAVHVGVGPGHAEVDARSPRPRPITDQPPYNCRGAVYDSDRAQIVLFGGYSGSTRELWELDGTDEDMGRTGPPRRTARSSASTRRWRTTASAAR